MDPLKKLYITGFNETDNKRTIALHLLENYPELMYEQIIFTDGRGYCFITFPTRHAAFLAWHEYKKIIRGTVKLSRCHDEKGRPLIYRRGMTDLAYRLYDTNDTYIIYVNAPGAFSPKDIRLNFSKSKTSILLDVFPSLSAPSPKAILKKSTFSIISGSCIISLEDRDYYTIFYIIAPGVSTIQDIRVNISVNRTCLLVDAVPSTITPNPTAIVLDSEFEFRSGSCVTRFEERATLNDTTVSFKNSMLTINIQKEGNSDGWETASNLTDITLRRGLYRISLGKRNTQPFFEKCKSTQEVNRVFELSRIS